MPASQQAVPASPESALPASPHQLDGSQRPRAFKAWLALSQRGRRLDIGRILQQGTVTELSQEVLAAYEAPFPDEEYKAGARVLPTLVPIRPDDPSTEANRRAWRALHRFEKPFLTAFSDGDPIAHGAALLFQRLAPTSEVLKTSEALPLEQARLLPSAIRAIL